MKTYLIFFLTENFHFFGGKFFSIFEQACFRNDGFMSLDYGFGTMTVASSLFIYRYAVCKGAHIPGNGLRGIRFSV